MAPFRTPPTTPHKNGPTLTIPTQQQPITLDFLYNQMMTQFDIKNQAIMTQLDEIRNNQKEIVTRLDKIEKDKDAMMENQEKMKETLFNFQQNVAEDMNHINSKLNEEIVKLRKINNLIIMGVPENDGGLALIKKLLEIILPEQHNNITILNKRLGRDPVNGKPRPLRITLNSQSEKELALNNCKKLKGMEEFAKISVRPDLTKQQQHDRAARTPIQTRATTKKRRLTDPSSSQPLPKQPKTNDEAMDQSSSKD
jgi:predicted phage tail protein